MQKRTYCPVVAQKIVMNLCSRPTMQKAKQKVEKIKVVKLSIRKLINHNTMLEPTMMKARLR